MANRIVTNVSLNVRITRREANWVFVEPGAEGVPAMGVVAEFGGGVVGATGVADETGEGVVSLAEEAAEGVVGAVVDKGGFVLGGVVRGEVARGAEVVS